mmetsp:Transcript_11687/g.18089  ORF Transcript_11687/g.18089 Transcript_11687/m.18089 type:complete len:95 (-) Transcript_11687:89-373(-)
MCVFCSNLCFGSCCTRYGEYCIMSPCLLEFVNSQDTSFDKSFLQPPTTTARSSRAMHIRKMIRISYNTLPKIEYLVPPIVTYMGHVKSLLECGS